MAGAGEQPPADDTPGSRASGRPRRASAGRGGAAGTRAVGGKRHQARILALQVLYEVDVTGHAVDDVIAHTFADQPPTAPVRAHVERLVRGTLGAHGDVDPLIADAAPAFPLAQVPSVDRNVLRLAIFELLNEPEVPAKAAINEAVELAKRFGGANSGRFVNGVLGTVAERVGRVDGRSPARADSAEAPPNP